VVVADNVGVVKLLPVAILEPPEAEVYHFTVPDEGTALNVVVPDTQILPGVVLLIAGMALTVAFVVPAALEQPLTVTTTE